MIINFLFCVSITYLLRLVILIIKDFKLLIEYNRKIDNLQEGEEIDDPDYWIKQSHKKERVLVWLTFSYLLYYIIF